MAKIENTFESSEILRKAFLALKTSDGLSLRKWSALVDINVATLTRIINSQRLVPKKHLPKLAKSLDFDAVAQNALVQAHSRDWLRSKNVEPEQIRKAHVSEDRRIQEIIENDEVLLKSWLHLSILESTICNNFVEDISLIAKQFGVHSRDVQAVLHDLELAGYLVREKGSLKKKNKKMRIPTKRSRQLVREFHTQMLRKATLELQASDSASFAARLINGYTVAVNPDNIESAKLVLEKALIEAATLLTEGTCTEVYQLQLQLFPLSKTKHR